MFYVCQWLVKQYCRMTWTFIEFFEVNYQYLLWLQCPGSTTAYDFDYKAEVEQEIKCHSKTSIFQLPKYLTDAANKDIASQWRTNQIHQEQERLQAHTISIPQERQKHGPTSSCLQITHANQNDSPITREYTQGKPHKSILSPTMPSRRFPEIPTPLVFLMSKCQHNYLALHLDDKTTKTNSDMVQLKAKSVDRYFAIWSGIFKSKHFDEHTHFIENLSSWRPRELQIWHGGRSWACG